MSVRKKKSVIRVQSVRRKSKSAKTRTHSSRQYHSKDICEGIPAITRASQQKRHSSPHFSLPKILNRSCKPFDGVLSACEQMCYMCYHFVAGEGSSKTHPTLRIFPGTQPLRQAAPEARLSKYQSVPLAVHVVCAQDKKPRRAFAERSSSLCTALIVGKQR